MKIDNPYMNVFRNKNYSKLFLAYLISQVGNVTGITAFAFYLLDRFSEKPLYTTLAELMYSLPALFLFFITGVLADRLDRRKIAINCDIICAILTLTIYLSIKIDILPFIFLLLFIRSGVTKFFEPAAISLVRGVVSKAEYPFAMGLNQMLVSIFIILGSGLGAMTYWTLGIEGALLINMICFFISAYLIRLCKIEKAVRMPNGDTKLSQMKIPNIAREFRDGANYIMGNKLLLSLFVGILFLGIVEGGESVMKIFRLKYKLSPLNYEGLIVWLNGIYASGIFLGSLMASIKCLKKVALHHIITYTLLVMGCTHLIQGFTTNIWIFLSLHLIYAFTIPLCNIAFFGWLGQLVEQGFMGRVQGLVNPTMMLTFTATQGFIAIAFPKYVNTDFLFYMVATFEIILFVYFVVALPFYINKRKIAEETNALR